MSEKQEDFELAAVGDLQEAKTAFDIFKLLKRVSAEYSFRFFIVLNHSKGPGGQLVEQAVLSNWETELLHEGLKKQLHAASGLAENESWVLPATVSMSEAREGAASAEDRRVIEHYIEHGHEMMAFFPVSDGGDQKGAVIFSGGRGPLSTHEIMALYYISQHVYSALLKVTQVDSALGNPLSEREVECLGGAADGLTTEVIAAQMGITPHTVNYHFTNSVRKLGARNRLHAVAIALRRNWLG